MMAHRRRRRSHVRALQVIEGRTFIFAHELEETEDKHRADELLHTFREVMTQRLSDQTVEYPDGKQRSGSPRVVRFAVVRFGVNSYRCEVATTTGGARDPLEARRLPRGTAFNVAFIVPTGLGASIGGHAGDATPAARLIASTCDTLITHPNVVNASDINEMPENALYAEGSTLSRLLMGTIGLQPVRSNRILLVMDKHSDPEVEALTINAVSAARACLGCDIDIVRLHDPVKVLASFSAQSVASGVISNVNPLVDAINERRGDYDAVALATRITLASPEHQKRYFEADGECVNPWGGVEAMLTHALSLGFNMPIAHAPMVSSMKSLNAAYGSVDPRKAAEAVSSAYLHCVLKGLHRSPRITECEGITASDVAAIVVPDGCFGLPHLAGAYQGIPVIVVEDNKVVHPVGPLPFKVTRVRNYLEAAGLLVAMRQGISPDSVRRPLSATRVIDCYSAVEAAVVNV